MKSSAVGVLGLLAAASMLQAQPASESESRPGPIESVLQHVESVLQHVPQDHWAFSRANDVLTGWTDVAGMADELAKEAGEFSRTAYSWARTGSRGAALGAPQSMVDRAADLTARNLDKADELTALSRSLASNSAATQVGSFAGRWGTPIGAVSGAVGSIVEGDPSGALQDLLNGAGATQATAAGGAAGFAAGGPWGMIIGGIVGNTAYTFIGAPVVGAVADELAFPSGGPADQKELWQLAQTRIAQWRRNAEEMGAAANEILQGAGVDGLEPRISAFESELNALNSRIEALTEQRLQACASGLPDFDAIRARFDDSIAAVGASLERTVSYETESCNLLNQMAAADAPDVARLWRGYSRYAAGRASAGPRAAAEALVGAERALADQRAALEPSATAVERAAQMRPEYASLQGDASSLSSRAQAIVAELRRAADAVFKAKRLRDQAAALLQRAGDAAWRHRQRRTDFRVVEDAERVFFEIGSSLGSLPDPQRFEQARQRQADLRSRVDLVIEQADELAGSAVAGLDSLSDCVPEAPDSSAWEAELETARENARLTQSAADRAEQCRSQAERFANDDAAGGWDLSGSTETISSTNDPAPPAPTAAPRIDGLIGAVAAAAAACDYGTALRAARAVEAADPQNPWVQNNQAAIAELAQLSSLDLAASIRRANIYLSTGNDTAWAQALAPFLQAGCRAPALEQHLAGAQARSDGRSAERESVMADRVGESYDRSNRNSAAFGAATAGLIQAASSRAAARRARAAGPTSSPGSGPRSTSGGTAPPAAAPGTAVNGCVMQPGVEMEGRYYVVVQWVPAPSFMVIPYNRELGDYNPRNARVIGRYKSYPPARAAVERACPPSRRMGRR